MNGENGDCTMSPTPIRTQASPGTSGNGFQREASSRKSIRRGLAAPPSKLGSFEIGYSNPTELDLGDTIQGRVELRTTRRVIVHKMRLTFYAEAQYFDERKRLTAKQLEYLAQDLFVNQNDNNGQLLEPGGTYLYEFFISTQKDWPCAFLGKKAALYNVLYYSECTVTELDSTHQGIDHVKRKPILLRCPLVSIPDPSTGQSFAHKGIVYVRNVLDMSGCVAATVTVINRQYSLGDNCPFNCEVLNCFRKLKVYVSIVQDCEKKGIATTISEDGHPYTLVKVKVGTLNSGETYKQWYGHSLWIPDPQLIPLQIPAEQWAFRLTVKPLVGKPLILQLPIKIDSTTTITTLPSPPN